MKFYSLVLSAVLLTHSMFGYSHSLYTFIGATPVSSSVLHWGTALLPSCMVWLGTATADMTFQNAFGAAPVAEEVQQLFDTQARSLGLSYTIYRLKSEVTQSFALTGETHIAINSSIWLDEEQFMQASQAEKDIVIALALAQVKNKKTAQKLLVATLVPVITELTSSKLGSLCKDKVPYPMYYVLTSCITKALVNVAAISSYIMSTQNDILYDAVKILGNAQPLIDHYNKMYMITGLPIHKKNIAILEKIKI